MVQTQKEWYKHRKNGTNTERMVQTQKEWYKHFDENHILTHFYFNPA